jgi:pyruvate/2-oxoglutarate/acetoin dehydrogenase E1 component
MSTATETKTEQRYIDALGEGMALALDEDERVVVLGIDVGEGGGIFRVTKGLHERFGGERIIDAPISEMGYVGAAVGAAMTGLRPIVEIMFMDFVGVCLDPILNQAAKLRYMTAGSSSACRPAPGAPPGPSTPRASRPGSRTCPG